MLRKRVHAPQLEGELTLSPALHAVGMMKPMDEPSAKRMKPDASESRYRSQLHGAATELASRRNPKTAARQEVCVECDTCPVTTPLSSLGLAKAPTQVRIRTDLFRSTRLVSSLASAYAVSDTGTVALALQ
jgi:hypothetical protein